MHAAGVPLVAYYPGPQRRGTWGTRHLASSYAGETVSFQIMRALKQRNNLFDLLRITFAILVLLAHAPEQTDGNRSREIFSRLTGADITFGVLAVDGFFLLSGFLIARSWASNPKLSDFLRNRFLRIVPGYVCAAILSTLVVGYLAPGVPDFFSHLGHKFWLSLLLLGSPLTPAVLPGLQYQLVNGPLWTITYEVRCYLLVAVFGLCGFIRKPLYWLGATVAFGLLAMVPTLQMHLAWPRYFMVFGAPSQVYRLTFIYLIGGCFYLFQDRILYRRWMIPLAVSLILISRLTPAFEYGIACGGAYLMFYAGQVVRRSERLHRLPDISYGIYLYGWPVESLWIWYHRGSPWIAFFVSTAICIVLGWLSWHFVERPALKAKHRPTAVLAPS